MPKLYKRVDLRYVRKCPDCFGWLEYGDAVGHERFHEMIEVLRAYIVREIEPQLPLDPNERIAPF